MTLVLPIFLAILTQADPLVIPGEQLVYEVRSSTFGRMGTATFRVAELDDGTVRLRFDFEARVLLFSASDNTVSDLNAQTLETVRYEKRERTPVGKRTERVIIDHESSTWTDAAGRTHSLASGRPLDELSFIYLVRSLDLEPGEQRVLRRHFDAARNPITVRMTTDADAALDVVEMTVPDTRQDNGRSVLRFHLTRDQRRVPLRIESAMPMAGRVTMTLISGL